MVLKFNVGRESELYRHNPSVTIIPHLALWSLQNGSLHITSETNKYLKYFMGCGDIHIKTKQQTAFLIIYSPKLTKA
jgi:hypothetical protein